MTMQITIDPNKLDNAQRKALADFILSYPSATVFGELTLSLKSDNSKSIADMLGSELNEEPTPEAAFGNVGGASANVGDIVSVDNQSTVTIPPAMAGTTVGVVTGNGVDLDKNGLPWDMRIHANNKVKISDGTWRKRRGVEDAQVALVEAELRQLMNAPAAQQVPLPVAVPVAPPPPASNEMPPIPANMIRAPNPPVVAPAVPPAAPAPDARAAYTALVGRTASALSAGKITQEMVIECCNRYGVKNLPLLISRLDLVPQIAADIDAIISTVGAA